MARRRPGPSPDTIGYRPALDRWERWDGHRWEPVPAGVQYQRRAARFVERRTLRDIAVILAYWPTL